MKLTHLHIRNGTFVNEDRTPFWTRVEHVLAISSWHAKIFEDLNGIQILFDMLFLSVIYGQYWKLLDVFNVYVQSHQV